MAGFRRRFLGRVRDAVSYRLLGRTPVAVFAYHSVHPEATGRWGPWEYAVTPDAFDDAVGRITETYEVRQLSEVVASARLGDPPTEPTAVITFDDGYRDALTEALPILERHDAPATVFVTTACLDGPPPYEYRLAAAVRAAERVSVSVADVDVDTEVGGPQSRRETYERLRRATKFADRHTREAALVALDAPKDLDVDMLSTDDIAELDRSALVEIGAHGHDHVPLTTYDVEQQRRDVERSKERLEEVVDSPVETFSYPYGDHSGDTARVVADVGFEAAVTTVPRKIPARNVENHRYRLPRLPGEST